MQSSRNGQSRRGAAAARGKGKRPTPNGRPSMKPKQYRFHPACLLFPKLGDEELQELAADIKVKGLQHDIVLYKGEILDGRNRLAACEIAGVEPTFVEWDGEGSPTEWVISENLIRRHLSSSQRAVVAHDLLPLLEKEAKERQRRSKGRGKRYKKIVVPFPGTAPQRRLPQRSRRRIPLTSRASRRSMNGHPNSSTRFGRAC